MELTQSVLLAVVIVLTIFLVVLGFQVFYVLRDFRKTLRRLNRLFDDADSLVSEVKKPIEKAGTIIGGLTTGATIAHLLSRGDKKGEKDGKREGK